MQGRRVIIKNETKIISDPSTTTKENINESNYGWRFAFKNIIPVVNADKQANDSHPQHTRIKFSDLPLYVPILPLYKIEKVKDHEVKLVHKTVYPYVVKYRKEMYDTVCNVTCLICDGYCNVVEDVVDKKNKFVEYIRHPNNLLMRRAVFAFSILAGYSYGNKTKHITKKIFVVTLAAAYSGLLCFPKETDQYIRNSSDAVSRLLIRLVNLWCGSTYSCREKMSCPADMPTAKLAIISYNKHCEKRK